MTEQQKKTAEPRAIEKLTELNTDESKETVIRFGDALPLKEPKAVSISGTIDAPARWVEKRKDDIVSADSHVLVDRDRMTITLNIDENSAYMDQIVGTLTISTEMHEFGINTGEYMSCFDMADRIKQLRTYFETQQEAMKLVTELRSFKAKIDKEMELSDDKRGNRREMLSQAVDSNLPKSFNVVVPIFKGQEKQTLEVEVEINEPDPTPTLVSPSVDDAMTEPANATIDSELDHIESLYKEIVII